MNSAKQAPRHVEWPTDAAGIPLTLGEMVPDDAKAQLEAAARRFRDLGDPLADAIERRIRRLYFN